MTLDSAIAELKKAPAYFVNGCPHPRVTIPMDAARVLVKATDDYYLKRRIDDAGEWGEQTVRIYAEDRARLLVALTVAA